MLILITRIMKNKVKYLYTVDITNCNDELETAGHFAAAKVRAGIAPTLDQYAAAITCALERGVQIGRDYYTIYTVVDDTTETNEKKPNVFKRFWNWMKGSK